MIEIKYGKILTYDSYQAGILVTTKKEYEQSIMTTRENMLKDIIESIGVINRGETDKLDIHLEVNNKGEMRLVRKWSI